jgi:peptidoglycan/LPS O-acetylase OafA/YrhL
MAGTGTTKNVKKNNFTLIRICLATTVLIGHGIALTSTNDNLIVSIASGISVYSFFGISGYLLNETVRTNTVREFVLRRSARILPGFYINLFFVAIVFYPLSQFLTEYKYKYINSIMYIVKNSLLYPFEQTINGALQFSPRYAAWNNSIWTLSFEFFCYAALLFYVTIMKNRITLIFISIIVLQIVIRQIEPTLILHKFNTLLELSCYFFIGVAFNQRNLKTIILFLLIEIPFSTLESNPGFMLIVVGIIMVGRSKELIPIRNDISYGIYLYHFPIFQLIYNYQVYKGDDINYISTILIVLAISILIAFFSWKLVEKPSIDLARKYKEHSHGK